MFRSLFFSSPPLLSPFSSPSSLISFSFRPTAYNRVKRHGVYKSFSCRVPFSVEGGLLPPSFSSSKTSDLHFFLPRNRKSPEGGGEEGRTKAEERLTRPVQMSRDPAGFYEAHSRVINAARTSILISKLTKLEIRRYGAILSKRGNTLACHRCFAFCRAGFETAQKGQCLPRAEKGERSMQSGPTSFRVRSPAA